MLWETVTFGHSLLASVAVHIMGFSEIRSSNHHLITLLECLCSPLASTFTKTTRAPRKDCVCLICVGNVTSDSVLSMYRCSSAMKCTMAFYYFTFNISTHSLVLCVYYLFIYFWLRVYISHLKLYQFEQCCIYSICNITDECTLFKYFQ